MAYFPFFIDLKYKKCCIIGGGVIAFRKIEALMEFEAEITVIAPYFCDDIRKLENRLHLIQKTYTEKDIEDAFMVIAATDDPGVNSAVSEACRQRNIPVNVVDEMDKCSFLFPAYVKRGPITIGITTSGRSPVIAGHIKNSIKNQLPDYYVDLVETLGEFREYVKLKVASSEERSSIFKELARIGLENCQKLTQEEVDHVIKKYRSQ